MLLHEFQSLHQILGLVLLVINFVYAEADDNSTSNPSTPSITLHYFNVPWQGRDEPIRWVLAYGVHEDWTFRGVQRGEWSAIKPTTPFGQLPFIEIDGKRLGQTYAILRYLAKKYGLAGKDDWESAQVDAVADYIKDAGQGYTAYNRARMSKDETAMKKAGDEYAGTVIQPFLAKVESILQDNKDGQDFLVGKKPTWADILLTTQLDRTIRLKSDLLEPYPLLKAHTERVHNLKDFRSDEIPLLPEYYGIFHCSADFGFMAPQVILHYFNLRARAEIIRWILSYSGVEWKDTRVERAEWPSVAPKTPFGQLPYVEVAGKPTALAQTYAIARYLARQYGLAGQDDWEEAQVDALTDYAADAGQGYSACIQEFMAKDDNNSAAMASEFCTFVSIKPFLDVFERTLRENKAGPNFLVGTKPTWADFVVVILLDRSLNTRKTLLDPYPLLKAFRERIRNLKGIKEWLAKRPATPF